MTIYRLKRQKTLGSALSMKLDISEKGDSMIIEQQRINTQKPPGELLVKVKVKAKEAAI